jgi:F-type H+-transporting ATPase subunit b
MQLPDLSLLLMMAIFWATFFVLRASVFKPIGDILEERERSIADAETRLADAVEGQKAAAAELDRRLTEARREAMSRREALRQEAMARRQARLDEAREKARASAAEAQGRLEGEIAAAREQLRASGRELAAEIAGGVLGRKVA